MQCNYKLVWIYIMVRFLLPIKALVSPPSSGPVLHAPLCRLGRDTQHKIATAAAGSYCS